MSECVSSLQPDFSKEPLTSDDDVSKWLKFYDMSSPLTCLSEFVSHDPVSRPREIGGHSSLSSLTCRDWIYVWNTLIVSVTMVMEAIIIMTSHLMMLITTVTTLLPSN